MQTKETFQMGRERATVARGFTLIEVLVVVAIIALLISILLPALKAAREEAKKVVCASNEHQIGIASTSYFNSAQNRFPWGRKKGEFYSHFWGGESDKGDGNNSPYWNKYYGPSALPGRHIPASLRPVNKYLVGRSLGKDSDASLPVFQCPNDDGVRSRSSFAQPKSTFPSFQVMGTSYDSNVTWKIYTEQVEYPSDTTKRDARINYLADRILYLFEKKGASKAVIAYEDPADATLGGVLFDWHPDLKYMGWHGRPNHYTSLFLDGHSENLYMPHKKVLDYNFNGAGGGINISCNPASGKCMQGDARWFVRHDYMQQ